MRLIKPEHEGKTVIRITSEDIEIISPRHRSESLREDSYRSGISQDYEKPPYKKDQRRPARKIGQRKN